MCVRLVCVFVSFCLSVCLCYSVCVCACLVVSFIGTVKKIGFMLFVEIRSYQYFCSSVIVACWTTFYNVELRTTYGDK
jgi:hypothetical protein